MKALLANDVTGPSAVLSTNQSCFVAFKSQAFSARRPCEESLKVYLEIHISCEKSRGPGNSKDRFGKDSLKQTFRQTHPFENSKNETNEKRPYESLGEKSRGPGNSKDVFGKGFLKQVFCQTHPSEIIRTKQTRSGHTEALARSPRALGTRRIYLGMVFLTIFFCQTHPSENSKNETN